MKTTPKPKAQPVTLESFHESRRLDVTVLNAIYGVPMSKIHIDSDMPEWLYWIPSGKPWRTHHIGAKPVPRFTEGEAFRLVDKICTIDGPIFSLCRVRGDCGGTEWDAEFQLHEISRSASDVTAGVAVCLAALRWVSDTASPDAPERGSGGVDGNI